MMTDRIEDRSTSNGGGREAAGLILVGLGILFLAGQLFGADVWRDSWPLVIILPGLLCFVGMFVGGREAGALAIPGSILTTIGAILLYQNAYHHWESWAYAWALIPAAGGIGIAIQGLWSRRRHAVQSGLRTAGTFLVVFVLAAIVFDGFGLGIPNGVAWALALIALGFYLLFYRGKRGNGDRA